MAIIQTMTTSFKVELLEALHDFDTPGGSVFKLALYTSLANLDANTGAYTAAGEAVGAGYVAGGLPLVNLGVGSAPAGPVAGVGFVDFADLTFPNVSITARGALIYNSSQANRSVCVLDFGADKTATAGDFTIIFPVPGATTAIIRIS